MPQTAGTWQTYDIIWDHRVGMTRQVGQKGVGDRPAQLAVRNIAEYLSCKRLTATREWMKNPIRLSGTF